MNQLRVVIVGGVAGGASTAARLRRLAEGAKIVLMDKGQHVSFASCGLPYRVGNVIDNDTSLVVTTPDRFRMELGIDVRVKTLVESIDRESCTVRARDLDSGETYDEGYDKLVLSPGAFPIIPPWPGVDQPGIFSVRTIPDVTQLRTWIETHGAKSAAVVGGGFIGVEMAENLKSLGLEKVTLLDLADQVLTPFDPEIAAPLQKALEDNGVRCVLGDAVSGFERRAGEGGPITVSTAGGVEVEAGVVILAIGVRPAVDLARNAGLTIGDRGGIRVNEFMQTSDPKIYGVGDAVECLDRVTKQWHPLALAGPANRQGRVAASHITHAASKEGSPSTALDVPEPQPFTGVLNTSVVSVFGLTAAMTGASEKVLRRAGAVDYVNATISPGSHVTYFPDASPLRIKLLCESGTGKILGAQSVGVDGAPRRVDVVATAMAAGSTAEDLIDLELCYSPQHGAAKDPINLAGMVASNMILGTLRAVHWPDVIATWGDGPVVPGGAALVDVRSAEEFERGHIDGSVNVPYPEIRERAAEVPHDAHLVCVSGQRAYNASRILRQLGGHEEVRVMAGGFRAFLDFSEFMPAAKQKIVGTLWDPSYNH